jgi:hypothetical protein
MRLPVARIARCLLLAAFSLLASAAVSQASGLNLAWTQCAVDGGASNRNFACNSNTGAQVIVASFQNSSAITEPVGVEAVIDMQSADATLPSWWTQQIQGGCRPNGAQSWAVVASGSSNLCHTDLSDAWSATAFGQFTPGFAAPNRLRFAMGYSLADTTVTNLTALAAGSEFYVLTLAVSNRATVGTSCTGCSTPACFVFNSLKIHRRDGLPDVVISNPGAHPYATWQGGAIGGLGCPAATPAHGTTWGVLKSMYR